MIDSRELISATRQLGSLTEAGVDILRAIKVLRAQTQNAELMALYDRLAHELRLGTGLAEAMSHAPEGFSEFAVSLVRQGEARGDLATSFYRIADYLQKEREVSAPPETLANQIITTPFAASDHCPLWLRHLICKFLGALGGLLVLLLLVEFFVAMGIIGDRWHLVAIMLVAALYIFGFAFGLRHTKEPSPNTAKSTFTGVEKDSTDNSTEATFE